MNGSRRLASAEQVRQPGRSRIDAWRHRESTHQHQRQQNENHDKVSELLEHVVALRLFSARVSEAHMINYGASNTAEVTPRRRQIPRDVPPGKAVDDIRKPIYRKYPREEEMPPPSFGKRLIAWESDP